MNLSESEIVSEIQALTKSSRGDILTGVGDDAAVVLFHGGRLVSTVDMLMEGTHFDFKYTSLEGLGHKSLAVNLSDLAAMGATPRWVLVSLALPKSVTITEIKKFYGGLLSLAERFEVAVIGGNLCRADHWVVDVTALGEAKNPVALRKGAREGDLIFVSGPLGRSAAGLALLGLGQAEAFPELAKAHSLPEPKVAFGCWLAAEGVVTAMIDISDGLALDLARLCVASRVGATIELQKLVNDNVLKAAARDINGNAMDWVLYGGEDYELLFTVPNARRDWLIEQAREKGFTLFEIGEISSTAAGIQLRSDGKTRPLEVRGWDHFRS